MTSAAAPRIHWLDAVDSTSAEALRRLERGDANAPAASFWIAARRQTAGRGRRGRPWRADIGDLTASLALSAPGPAERVAELSFVAALAVVDLCDQSGVRPPAQVKWPNDVLIDGRKAAGVLLEARAPWVVIGVGVNLVAAPEPAALEAEARPAAALGDHVVEPVSAETALTRLAAAFEQRAAQWRREGFAQIRAAWLGRCFGRGASLIARLPGRALRGVFRDVDAAGALLLEAADGQLHRIHAAELYFDQLRG